MNAREFRERLGRRARHANLTISPELMVGLEGYYQLLAKWNAKVNLTAFRLAPGGEDEAIDRLLLEPVVAARYLPADAVTLLDAGSGGGSPAIPLKLAGPTTQAPDGRSEDPEGRLPAGGRPRAAAREARRSKPHASRSCSPGLIFTKPPTSSRFAPCGSNPRC